MTAIAGLTLALHTDDSRKLFLMLLFPSKEKSKRTELAFSLLASNIAQFAEFP